MAAHKYRYWQIFFIAMDNQDYPCLAEVAMAESSGGTNVIGSGVASADSELNPTYGPAMAVDGNPSTSWVSTNWHGPVSTAIFWQYDFGSGNAFNIAEVSITTRTGGDALGAPRTFYLRCSDDGASFVTVEKFTSATWTSGATQTFTTTPVTIVDAPSSGTKFDALTLDGGLVLSNGDLTVTSTAAGTNGVKSTTAHSAGKYYVEVARSSADEDFVGFCDPAASYVDIAAHAKNACGVISSGNLYVDGFDRATLDAYIYSPVQICLDLDNWRMWMNDRDGDPGRWSGYTGYGDPTVPSTGIDIGMFRHVGLALCVVTQASGSIMTANFGASPNVAAGAVPAGFGPWDAALAGTVMKRAQAVIMA